MCACGLVRDLAAWERLPYLGIQRDEPHALELRNCTCGSTCGLELTPEVAALRAVAATRVAYDAACVADGACAASVSGIDGPDADDLALGALVVALARACAAADVIARAIAARDL